MIWKRWEELIESSSAKEILFWNQLGSVRFPGYCIKKPGTVGAGGRIVAVGKESREDLWTGGESLCSDFDVSQIYRRCRGSASASASFLREGQRELKEGNIPDVPGIYIAWYISQPLYSDLFYADEQAPSTISKSQQTPGVLAYLVHAGFLEFSRILPATR